MKHKNVGGSFDDFLSPLDTSKSGLATTGLSGLGFK